MLLLILVLSLLLLLLLLWGKLSRSKLLERHSRLDWEELRDWRRRQRDVRSLRWWRRWGLRWRWTLEVRLSRRGWRVRLNARLALLSLGLKLSPRLRLSLSLDRRLGMGLLELLRLHHAAGEVTRRAGLHV